MTFQNICSDVASQLAEYPASWQNNRTDDEIKNLIKQIYVQYIRGTSPTFLQNVLKCIYFMKDSYIILLFKIYLHFILMTFQNICWDVASQLAEYPASWHNN